VDAGFAAGDVCAIRAGVGFGRRGGVGWNFAALRGCWRPIGWAGAYIRVEWGRWISGAFGWSGWMGIAHGRAHAGKVAKVEKTVPKESLNSLTG